MPRYATLRYVMLCWILIAYAGLEWRLAASSSNPSVELHPPGVILDLEGSSTARSINSQSALQAATWQSKHFRETNPCKREAAVVNKDVGITTERANRGRGWTKWIARAREYGNTWRVSLRLLAAEVLEANLCVYSRYEFEVRELAVWCATS